MPGTAPASRPSALRRVLAAARVALDDANRLAAAWAQVIGMAGAYEGMGEPVAHQAGDYTVVDVPLRFEAAEMTGRVSYDRAGQVAGLFFLNKG